ncbi:MAG: hypothetical protein J6T40_10875 [Clostridiales bacterium]|nr:hypothetical protein [Clostridiales bacterium]
MGSRRWSMYALMSLIVVAFMVFCFVKIFGSDKDDEKVRQTQMKRVEEAADMLNSRNLDVMYIGADLGAPSNFRARHIYNFEYESLENADSPAGHVGHMIIINDPTGDLFISDDQWSTLSELRVNYGYYIVYFGNAKFEKMKEAGLISSIPSSTVKSMIVWGSSSAPGFADDTALIPSKVLRSLSAEQVPVYAMIMELSTYERYWN